jgi:hypothetical protein
MLRTVRAGIALALLSFLALLAAPTAASAYVPDGSGAGRIIGQPAPGAALRVAFDGAFSPDEAVEILISCPGREDLRLTDTADAAGSTDTGFSVPAGVTGSCTITATGVSSGSVATAAFTVVDPDSPAADPSDPDLAVTGVSPAVAVWVGAGALVLGGVLLRIRFAARASRR